MEKGKVNEMKKLGVWLIIIGVFFLSIDIAIQIGDLYPEMIRTKKLGELFQTYVINNFIGSRPSVDIFNDLIGLVCIFLGSALLVKRSQIFIAAMLLVPIPSILYIIIPQLPYQVAYVSLLFPYSAIFLNLNPCSRRVIPMLLYQDMSQHIAVYMT